MVRTILNSRTLRDSSSLQFIVLVVGLFFMLGSLPMWLGIADQDYRFSLAGERENLPIAVQTSASPYAQLPPAKQRTVDRAIAGDSFYYEDGTTQLPRFVSKSNTYYEFNSGPTIDWADPRSFLPVVIGIVGVWLIIEAIQHRRIQLGPYGY